MEDVTVLGAVQASTSLGCRVTSDLGWRQMTFTGSGPLGAIEVALRQYREH